MGGEDEHIVVEPLIEMLDCVSHLINAHKLIWVHLFMTEVLLMPGFITVTFKDVFFVDRTVESLQITLEGESILNWCQRRVFTYLLVVWTSWDILNGVCAVVRRMEQKMEQYGKNICFSYGKAGFTSSTVPHFFISALKRVTVCPFAALMKTSAMANLYPFLRGLPIITTTFYSSDLPPYAV